MDSVNTDYPEDSPVRDALRAVLRMPFEEAFPYVEGEGREHGDENELSQTQIFDPNDW